jgi:hypothetical protein
MESLSYQSLTVKSCSRRVSLLRKWPRLSNISAVIRVTPPSMAGIDGVATIRRTDRYHGRQFRNSDKKTPSCSQKVADANPKRKMA